MIVAAFVSFFSFYLVLSHLPAHWMRRIVGQKGKVDVILHVTVIWMFLGTSTAGLLQAEAAAICFSLYLRGYHYLKGYEVIERGRWVRYPGAMT